MGDFICAWPMSEFLQNYGAYLEKMDDYIDAQQKKQDLEMRNAMGGLGEESEDSPPSL